MRHIYISRDSMLLERWIISLNRMLTYNLRHWLAAA